ncbi:hypothetical protein C1646_753669 [Rhizophagus diaphanus]|nr:hypothetical protein C1646_753669 [Rhizophagus diaphanus] [Rhizophagus sp. MUCL 43196]
MSYCNTNNLHSGLSRIFLNFNNINIKEIEPTTEKINEYISEDLNNMVDELVDLIFKKLNEEEDEGPINEYVLDYINNQETTLKKLNQKGIKLCKKAIGLKNSVVQLYFTNVFKYDTNYYYLPFELSKKFAEQESEDDIDVFDTCYWK